MLKILLVLTPVIKGSVVCFQYKTVAPAQGDCSHNQVNSPSVGAYRLQQEKQEAERLSPVYLRKISIFRDTAGSSLLTSSLSQSPSTDYHCNSTVLGRQWYQTPLPDLISSFFPL